MYLAPIMYVQVSKDSDFTEVLQPTHARTHTHTHTHLLYSVTEEMAFEKKFKPQVTLDAPREFDAYRGKYSLHRKLLFTHRQR